jgi:formiminotetrahydrofolate cyclodeaminase
VAPSAELSLGELLSALAERSPAPGAGSAAAWAGALAAALLEMTAAFSGVDDALGRGRVVRAQLLAHGEEELASYEPVLAAERLDASDPSREQRLRDALSGACEAPLAIAKAAAEVAELAAEVAARATRALEGDAIAGVLLAEAACQSAARLVEINLHGRTDDPRLAEAARLRDRAHAARERVLRG